MLVTVLRLGERRAHVPAELIVRDDGSGARLLPAPTRLRAGAPQAPRGNLAMLRARNFAPHGFVGGGARLATTQLHLTRRAPARLGPCRTARRRARRVSAPLVHEAVQRARLLVAYARIADERAAEATVRGACKNGARAGLHATAARERALAKVAPRRHGAVHRAGVDVTVLGLLQARAKVTAQLRVRDHGPAAHLRAAAARCRAFAPRAPCSHAAVLRAVRLVARALRVLRRARLATVGRVAQNSAHARLLTPAARERARIPGTPLADGAVDRARVQAAQLLFRKGRASKAANVGVLRDDTRARLPPMAARLRALAPRTPARHLTVVRARARVACDSLTRSWARGAAVAGLPCLPSAWSAAALVLSQAWQCAEGIKFVDFERSRLI